ncbi:holin [Nakamurella sp.]|uniref:holin n=1 Tax=Nakamurella sp. TaxID=1869182 RepID=UPI003B3AD815
MFEGKFWKATGERAVKSAAQALLIYFGGDAVFNAWQTDWPAAGGIASGAVVLSVLTSLVSAKLSGEPDSPSLVPADR